MALALLVPVGFATLSSLPIQSSPGGVVLHEDAELLPDGGGECMGYRVAADADTIVAGAVHDSSFGQWSGAAYVFVRSGTSWVRQAKLQASDGQAFDYFGSGVEVDGDRAFIGATDSGGGAVYAYVRSGAQWLEQQKLRGSDVLCCAAFGGMIACQDDELFIGAPLDDGGVIADLNLGAVFVFDRVGTTWVERVKLVPADVEPQDTFGSAIDVDGDTLLISSAGEDDLGAEAGAAYVYRRAGSQWIEEAKLVAPDGESGDYFGRSVSLEGDLAAIGTHFAFAVYVYRRNGTTWTLETTLSYPNNGRFGRSVALKGDLLLVGALIDSTYVHQAGSAFVFRRSGSSWLPLSTLLPTGLAQGDNYGWASTWSGTDAVVGSYLDDSAGMQGGAVLVFSAGAPTTYCTGKTSSMGCVPFVATSGVPSVSATHSFEIRAHQALRDEAGLLLYGFNKANFNFHGGKLCLKGALFRLLPPKPAKATGPPPCTGVLRRNFQGHLQSGANPLLTVGQTVRAQWLQRDPADPLGFGDGLTDAVQFTVGP